MKTNMMMLVAVVLFVGCGADAVGVSADAMNDVVEATEDMMAEARQFDVGFIDVVPEGCNQGISIQCKGDYDCKYPGPCQINGICDWVMDGPLCTKKCVYDDICLEGDVCLPGNICCTPTNTCDERECGDNGCGTNCGECGGSQETCIDGQCVCQPDCVIKSCGPDGCGGVCGTCAENQVCTDDSNCCTTTCDNKECGPNGCGGVCGECPFPNDICTADQTCFCIPDCSNKHCGDDGCGGECWKCPEDETCVDGECIPCTPQCDGKSCGPDGCGGVCGKCQDNFICTIDGQCVCVPDSCADKECGPDGCGEVCGTCKDGWTCMPDGWCCEPQCDNKECGPDGCGGECSSSCSYTEQCWDMTCIPAMETKKLCFNGDDDDKDGAQDCEDVDCDDVSFISTSVCNGYSKNYYCWLGEYGPGCGEDLDGSCFGPQLGCSVNGVWIKPKTPSIVSIYPPGNDSYFTIYPVRVYYPGPQEPDGIPAVDPIFLWWVPSENPWDDNPLEIEVQSGETVLVVSDPYCPEDVQFCPYPW